jgi:hypothetical protein
MLGGQTPLNLQPKDQMRRLVSSLQRFVLEHAILGLSMRPQDLKLAVRRA